MTTKIVSASRQKQCVARGSSVPSLLMGASVVSALCMLQSNVRAATATDLTDTQAAMRDAVLGACVGLNSLAINGDPTNVTIEQPDPQQIATLNAGQRDLLARCADAIEAGGFGVQQQTQTDQTHADAKSALAQLAPDEIAAQGTTSVRAVNTQQNNIGARVSALQSGLRGFSLNQLSMNSDGAGGAPFSGGSAGDEGSASRFGAFINGNLSKGDKDATNREAGFDFDRTGVTVGVDYFVQENAFVGAAVGFGKNEIDMDNNGGGLDSDTLSLSLYGSVYQKESFYVNGFLDYTKSEHDSQRNLSYTLNETDGGCCENTLTGNTITVNQAATGSADGEQLTLAVGAGHEKRKDQWTYGPSIEVTYTNLKIDGFTESMTDPNGVGRGLALSYDDQDIDSLRSDVGFFVNRANSMKWGILTTQARIDWYHEFEDDSRQIVARYVFDPANTALNLKTDDVDSDYFAVNLDVSAAMAGGKSFFVSYGVLLGLDNISYQQIVAGFRAEF